MVFFVIFVIPLYNCHACCNCSYKCFCDLPRSLRDNKMITYRGLSSLKSCLFKNTSALKHLLPQQNVDAFTGAVCFYGTQDVKPKLPASSSQFKVVVVGGGSGGCAVAAKFASLGKECAVVEPSDLHYYQPIWTLVGAGLKGFQSSVQPMRQVLPSSVEWIKDKAVTFRPEENAIILQSGEKVKYQYLVIAMGIQLDYDKVTGALEALAHDPSVVSNYHPVWVNKTFPALQSFKGGKAIFTFPNTPIKCAGAPQKIMYLAEEFFRTMDVRDKAEVIYNTSLGVIFGVKKYADALQKIVEQRHIKVNYKHNLVEVNYRNKTAIFEKLDDKSIVDFKYDFLHVTPPMSAPDILKRSSLVNDAGWVDVHKHTLQHTKFPNIFALGDCTSLPTSKTAAAVAAQSGILYQNLSAIMSGGYPLPLYDGYTSCPLITSSTRCILAEFDYDGQPLETFPFNQGKERRITYDMKAHIMPALYWGVMMRGKWNGPRIVRKLMHLGLGEKNKIQSK